MNPTCHTAVPWTLEGGIPWVATTSSRQRRSTERDVLGFVDGDRSAAWMQCALASLCPIVIFREGCSRLDRHLSIAFREGRSRLDLRILVAANHWWRRLYLAWGLPATKETTPKRPGRAWDWCRKTGRKRLSIQKPTRKYAKGSLSNAKFTKMTNSFAKPLEKWFLPFCQITQMPN